jgi:DNA mismatch repair ATPase MutS
MTDKLFSRIGFQDNIEQNASTFTIELREMEYIYSNLTPNSLVIIDELCRSTNPQEGEIICWSYCEKLLNFIGVSNDDYFKFQKNEESEDEDDDEMNGTTKHRSNNSNSLQIQGGDIKLKDIARPFIFLTTHFTSLTKLSEKYNNAIK